MIARDRLKLGNIEARKKDAAQRDHAGAAASPLAGTGRAITASRVSNKTGAALFHVSVDGAANACGERLRGFRAKVAMGQ